MTHSKPRFKLKPLTTALMLCTPLAAMSLHAQAAEETDKEVYRFAPIIVNSQAMADDDANSIVAKEISVGGKVATSILDTPASVSVITEKEIEQRHASTTEEVLQYTPGVITDFWGSDDRNDYFQIRGFQATTYRDGMTLGSMRGVREDAYAFERVEVIRGANSTLFGPADPGGSVNFVSKTPKFQQFGSGFVRYGTFDRKEVGIDVGDTLDEGKTLAYRFTGKLQDSEREYDYSEDDNEFFMGGLTWEPTDFTSATLLLDYLKRDSTPNSGGYPMDKEYDRGDFYGEPNYNSQEVERTSITGIFSHDFDNGFIVRANLRYSDLTDDFGYVYMNYRGDSPAGKGRSYFGTDNSAQELIGNAIVQYDAQFEHFDSSTLVGIEYRDASTKDTSFYGAAEPIIVSNPIYSGAPVIPGPSRENDQEYTTKSVFLQQNLSFFDRFIVSAGFRNDQLDLVSTEDGVRASDDLSETSLRGALTYKVNEEISTYISMVESVAPPLIGVEPELGKQYEVGAKFAPLDTNALYSVAIYDLTKENITINDPVDPSIRVPIGESEVKGIDLEAKVELTTNFTLTGGYSYMKSEVTKGPQEIEGNKFPTVPKQMASMWGHYTFPGLDMSLGLGVRYIDSYYFDKENSEKSDSATLVDTSFSYEFYKNTDLTLYVRNLFDEQHVVGSGTADYYNPGREVMATVNYNW